MPRPGSSCPSGASGANRSYWWLCPARTTSAPASYKAVKMGRISTAGGWLAPDVKSGWCQYASVQRAPLAARSARTHRSWAEPVPQPPTSAQLEFTTTTCHAPSS